jgi:hypothetical protein
MPSKASGDDGDVLLLEQISDEASPGPSEDSQHGSIKAESWTGHTCNEYREGMLPEEHPESDGSSPEAVSRQQVPCEDNLQAEGSCATVDANMSTDCEDNFHAEGCSASLDANMSTDRCESEPSIGLPDEADDNAGEVTITINVSSLSLGDMWSLT